MSRISYFTRRLAEIPPQVLARKAWLRVKPRLYAPLYACRRRATRSVPADEEIARVFPILASLPAQSGCFEDADYRIRAGQRAAAALAGRFTVLGYGETAIPSAQGWHCDPFHGYQWPRDYFPRIDFLAASIRCDVKIPWELSRLQFLPWLAEGVRLGGGDADACMARFEAVLSDWIVSNPAGFGVNWVCGMEVAIRAVNLVFSTALVADRMSSAMQAQCLRCLIEHRDYLHRFPEYSDVPGNHYLADLMGLAVLDCALDGPNSLNFARSVERFAAEAERQFDASGVHLEHATVYHRLCMDMLAIVHALTTHAEESVAQPLLAVMQRAMRFADTVASPGGKLPIFGDCDSGHILWFGADARQLDAMRSYCYGTERSGESADLACFLSSFRRGRETLFTSAPAVTGLCGPFVTMRMGAVKLIARHGRQGLHGRAPHDHDDAMSFWAFLGEEDLFVDIGCVGYTLDADDRRAAIVSTGHPVWSPAQGVRFVPVDGSVFATVRGAADAVVDLHETANDPAFSLNLRGRLGLSLAERRSFAISRQPDKKFVLTIDDVIHLHEPGAMEMVLRLGPGFVAEIPVHGRGISISRAGGGEACRLHFVCQGIGDTAIAHDIWAPQYGRNETITAIRLRTDRRAAHASTIKAEFAC